MKRNLFETIEYKNGASAPCVSRRGRSNAGVVRSVLQLEVLERRNADRIAIASPRDFATTQTAPDGPDTALPYCIDFPRRRALYVLGVEPEEAQAAPFYYLYLRRHARRLLSVPIEHAPLMRRSPAADPVFLFSPGRCGSTLLSRMLAEAGVASVSEPDFYTQMGTPFWTTPLNPARDIFRDAMWKMSGDLTAALGGVPVVKLRAECARAPEQFVRQANSRTLVMFRGFEDWARSTARVFGAGPRKAVRKYRAALECYARLSRISSCHLLRYEDLVNRPADVAADLARFLSVTIPMGAVQKVAASHSQEGTPLAGRARPGWEAKFDAAMRLWHSPRLVSAREKLEIPDVWG